MPNATSLAAEIEEKIGTKPELIQGGGGVFDIHADGQLIYSKQASGNEFPEHEPVIESLRQLGSR